MGGACIIHRLYHPLANLSRNLTKPLLPLRLAAEEGVDL